MAAILNVYGGATKGALAAEKGGSKLCSAIWMDWDATVQEQQKGLAVEPRSHAEPRGATRSEAERSGAVRSYVLRSHRGRRSARRRRKSVVRQSGAKAHPRSVGLRRPALEPHVY